MDGLYRRRGVRAVLCQQERHDQHGPTEQQADGSSATAMSFCPQDSTLLLGLLSSPDSPEAAVHVGWHHPGERMDMNDSSKPSSAWRTDKAPIAERPLRRAAAPVTLGGSSKGIKPDRPDNPETTGRPTKSVCEPPVDVRRAVP